MRGYGDNELVVGLNYLRKKEEVIKKRKEGVGRSRVR